MTDPAVPSKQPVETTFHVRFAETDAMGVVHHSAYVIYLEEGRSEFGRRRGAPYAALEAAGFSLAVTDLHIRYLAPAHYGQQVTVRTWIAKLQSRAITYQYKIFEASTRTLLVTAETRLVCIDRYNHVVRLPEQWADALGRI